MALLTVANTACYSFVPLAAGVAPSAGEQVRVHLSAEGSAVHAESLGARVQWAEGTMSERRPDGSIVVGVVQVRRMDGSDHFWSGQGVVTLAPAHVTSVQQRKMDRGRTRTAMIALGVGLVAIASLALGVGGAGGGPDGGGTPPPP